MARNFIIADPAHAKTVGTLIIKSHGLGALKPKFFKVSTNKDEDDARTEGEKEKGLSQFGLPVFDSLGFDALTYNYDETVNGVTKTKKVEIKPMTFETILIEVSMSKNVVLTPVSGRNGTVKEYVSDGDYMVTIRGVLVGNGIDVQPVDEKQHLIKFIQAPEAIRVASGILKPFGIHDLVIKDSNIGQVEGKRNVIPFELLCLSETPFEISQQDA